MPAPPLATRGTNAPVSRRPGWMLDLLAAALCFAAGLAIRQPELQHIPQFTDEVVEVQGAWKIVADGERPLVGVDHYNGPLWSYLLAAAITIAGHDAEVPRRLICLAGALTVALTYLLGRQWGGRLAGVVGAGLLATNYAHVLINSHVAWSNSLTPLFTTLALICAARAFGGEVDSASTERRWPAIGAPGWLPATGLAAGLAMQTHPSAVVTALGIAAAALISRRDQRWLRTPYPYVAALIALVVVLNLVVFNLQTAGGGLENAQERTYAYTGGAGLGEYAQNAANFGLGLVKMLASDFGDELTREGWPVTGWPSPLWAAILLGSLVVAWRFGVRIPAVLLAAAWLVIPYLNQSYGSPVMSRYLAFLMPPLFCAVGVAASRLWTRFRTPTGRPGRAIVALATAALVAYPLATLGAYYRDEEALGRTNRPLWAAVRTVEALRPISEVLIGRDLRTRSLRAGGHIYRVLDLQFLLEGVPHDGRTIEDIGEDLAAMAPPVYLILTDAERDTLAGRYDLEPLATGYDGPVVPGGWGVFRLKSH